MYIGLPCVRGAREIKQVVMDGLSCELNAVVCCVCLEGGRSNGL
jgi:hypothetical protein